MELNHLDGVDLRQLGERLKEARKARGLTQQNVAEDLGIVRTTLVAIEKGDRKVSASELISMAKMYGRPISEFVSKQANKQPFVPQFRLPPGQATVTEKELSAVVLELERMASDYVELEEINDAVAKPNFPPVHPLNIPGVNAQQRGEEVAAEERTRLGLGDGPIADLRGLLEEAVGVRVFYLNLPPKVGGLFACNDELGACIAVNRNHPPARGNWSLAHEYGHFLTTRYVADVSFIHDHWGKAAAEKFADSFAKNFLMPRTGVCRRLSDLASARTKGVVTVADVMSLANLYRVSAEAMFRRLEELKRIPHGKWDELKQKRGFQPEKARAALGLDPHQREAILPLRYRLLALSAYDQKEQLTEGQLARKLRTDRVSARMELESLRSLIDDSGEADDEEFLTMEFDVSDPVLA